MKPTNHRKKWTAQETALVLNKPRSMSTKQLAKDLGRSPEAINARKYAAYRVPKSPTFEPVKIKTGDLKRVIIDLMAHTIEIHFAE